MQSQWIENGYSLLSYAEKGYIAKNFADLDEAERDAAIGIAWRLSADMGTSIEHEADRVLYLLRRCKQRGRRWDKD